MAKSRARKPRSPKKPAKPKASGRGRGRGRKIKGRRRAPRRWLARLLALGMLFSLCLGIYVLYLDHTVRMKFEGKRWSIPARVYGRPVELYVGAKVTTAQLEATLKQLGYQQVRHPKQPASWSKNGSRYLVRTRSFNFWDGSQPSRLLDLRFSAGSLIQLKDGAGGDIDLIRLEAPEIGSIYPSHNEDRVLVKGDLLPEALVQALVVMEDRDFNTHYGINPKAIARAIWANLRAGRLVQGGSTLTQQLVKNFYLTRERSLWRKLNEAVMALSLDAHYSKPEILEAYANEIYLGQDGQRAIHGFGLASDFYFNRTLQELDISQLALLVAVVRGPSYYDPRRHPKRAKKRRDLVLSVMRDQGLISTAKAKRAMAAGLGVTSHRGRGRGNYPSFMDLVRRQLQRDYRSEDLTSEGLRIFTTLDPWRQQQAEEAVEKRINKLEVSHGLAKGKLEGAAVLVDSQSGEVSALVGGRSARFAGFNRALDAVRPIGSLVKPAIYLTALMQPNRYTLLTPIDDGPITVTSEDGGQWRPMNYDKISHGEVPLHQALAQSYNQSTVRLGMEVGLERVADTLKLLGIARPIRPFPAMLLGAVSLSPVEVAQFYQTLAAGGFSSPLRAIRGVQSSDGQALQRYPLTVERSVEAGPIYLLTRNLQEVVRNGTGRALLSLVGQDLHIAGKTGTTDGLRDSWFAGFSGDKVAVVWLGRDDNKPAGLSGSAGALRVWGDMMRRMNPQPLVLSRPDSVESVWIDPGSGFRADEGCVDARQYPFIQGSAPQMESSCVRKVGGSIRRLFRSFFE